MTENGTIHQYPGRLIIVEGIDGSGKSTQLQLLQRWLISQGHTVFFTEWNSSRLVKETTKLGKKNRSLTPLTFSLIHATDFADRLFYNIIPPLKAGMIVLADRYIYTAFARDVARGCDPHWVRKLYSFAIRPDLAFYFKVPVDVSLGRILSGRAKIKYYEAGMDLNMSADPVESFSKFQSRILEEYDRVVEEYQLTVIDATAEIDEQQEIVREVAGKMLAAPRPQDHGQTEVLRGGHPVSGAGIAQPEGQTHRD
ncbi:MAG: dTMP kinase [Candidatus Omnitrophica bacterium CG11_big_fil_rev_8_21_14_0_20_63_9]|nr:MAG: dTMP kinase [Candidatus Omnitrophica bacterium CG11_big_fil_rev_8_21_14_0_20_63_9]